MVIEYTSAESGLDAGGSHWAWHLVNVLALVTGLAAAIALSIMGLVSFDEYPVQHNTAASAFQGTTAVLPECLGRGAGRVVSRHTCRVHVLH